MSICCTHTCNQGDSCHIRVQRAAQIAANAASRAAKRATDHPAHDSTIPPRDEWLSTPAQLEREAGPEPIKPAPEWLEDLALVLAIVSLTAAVGLALGYHHVTVGEGLRAVAATLSAAWAAVAQTITILGSIWPRIG